MTTAFLGNCCYNAEDVALNNQGWYIHFHEIPKTSLAVVNIE